MMSMTSISNISTQITNNIFSKIDTNNLGYIDKTDLTSALSKINGSNSESDSNEVFNNMDTDGDGKLTKSELSKGIESLLSQLQSNAFQSSQGGMGGTDGMPPPPPPKDGGTNGDNGVTQDQASEIASSSDDSKLASLMKTVSENFEAADSNEDGKVSAQEAMAYQQKSEAAGNTTSSSSTSATSDYAQANNSANNIIQQLIKAYGFNESSDSPFLMNVSA